MAMEMLRSRLYELGMRKRMKQRCGEQYQEKIEWGSRYVRIFHPYKMIKDHRTILKEVSAAGDGWGS
jgi:peptide chain release factor 2